MRKNLVIVRAGDRSLHPQWLDRPARSWDLVVSYYGDYPARYEGQYDVFHHCKGSKWRGISDFLQSHPGLVENYDHVWLPDDDLLASGETIDSLFRLCKWFDFTIAQPALTPYSFHSWGITLQQPHSVARITNFVEIMAPCFKAETFGMFSRYFDECSSGWGYEWLWLKIARARNLHKFGIIDEAPVFHTRPVGSAGHGGSATSPMAEGRRLKERFDLQVVRPRVLATIQRNVAPGDGIQWNKNQASGKESSSSGPASPEP
jgi:hypothetical protein